MSDICLLLLVMVEATTFARIFQSGQVQSAISQASTLGAGTGFGGGGGLANGGWQLAVLGTACAVFAVMVVCRRLRLHWSIWMATALVLTWVVPAEVVLRPYLQWGLPLQHAFTAATQASASAADQFFTTVAPAPPLAGFVLWASWAVGVAGTLAYFLANVASTAGAALPPLVLFVCTCALGAPAGRYWASAATVAATALFLWVHHGPGVWEPNSPARLRSSGRRPGKELLAEPLGQLRRSGAPLLLAVVAVLACLGVTPALGREGSAPAGWHHEAASTRLTPDPLVTMRADLSVGSHLPAFVVRSTIPTYWRLTSLDHFDGSSWTASGSYGDVTGTLPTDLTPGPGAVTVSESFRIQDLGSPWLPVGFQPKAVKGIAAVSYDASSSSLLVPSQTADGTSYQVQATASAAVLDPARLQDAPALTTSDLATASPFLQLPSGLPFRVDELAEQLTSNEVGEYQKVLAIQSYFHRKPFVYTLAPPPYPAGDELSGFLFSTHAGYCQQYATAFTVLARLAGIPARVAVGFTTGRKIGADEWEVTGADAHAWPEVWFPGTGWVPFEPTPSFAYAAGGGPGPGASSASGAKGRATSRAGGQKRATERPASGSQGNRSAPVSHGASANRPLGGSQAGKDRQWVVALAAAAACAGAAVLGIGLWRRRRKVAADRGAGRAGEPDTQRAMASAALARTWERTLRRFARAGLGMRPGETPAEWARRASAETSPGAQPPRAQPPGFQPPGAEVVAGEAMREQLELGPHLEQLVEALYSATFGGPVPAKADIDQIERSCEASWDTYRRQLRHKALMAPQGRPARTGVRRPGNRRSAVAGAPPRKNGPTSPAPPDR